MRRRQQFQKAGTRCIRGASLVTAIAVTVHTGGIENGVDVSVVSLGHVDVNQWSVRGTEFAEGFVTGLPCCSIPLTSAIDSVFSRRAHAAAATSRFARPLAAFR